MNHAAARVVLKVEKGHAEPEELAAIVVALLARVTAPTEPASPRHRRIAATWHRPERRASFCAPHSWQCPRAVPR
ncbi:acyl-CoA carboxylase subunit epsilon [Nonomuraea sp. NPDC002799]